MGTATDMSSSVHVVVLAAGRGSRLGTLGAETPKWLLDVGGAPLAARHLEALALARAEGQAGSLRVVTGHAAPAVEAFLATRPEAGLATVHNPDFARLNNWFSLLLALRAIPDPEARVVVLNADLFVSPATVARFLADCGSTRAEGLLAVDFARELTDESMKVALRPDGTLARIGKVGVEGAAGEYVGMLMARGSALLRLRAALEAFVGRPEAANEWYEGAVGSTAAAGTPWTAWAMPSSHWVEIDDDHDLAAAVELLAA
jgi:choline kinase